GLFWADTRLCGNSMALRRDNPSAAAGIPNRVSLGSHGSSGDGATTCKKFSWHADQTIEASNAAIEISPAPAPSAASRYSPPRGSRAEMGCGAGGVNMIAQEMSVLPPPAAAQTGAQRAQ